MDKLTQFPHLELSYKGDASKKVSNFRPKVNPRTADNLKNRQQHAERLSQSIQNIRAAADETHALTLFLQIDPERVPVENLRLFNIEVVAEFQDGFILGSSAEMDLLTLRSKIERFLQGDQNSVAGLWSIADGKQWKLDRILSPYLYEHWPEIIQKVRVTVDLGIACIGTWELPNRPWQKTDEDEEHYQRRLANWNKKREKVFAEWENLYIQRETDLTNMVESYGGEVLDQWYAPEVIPDSFVARVSVSGTGLSDLVHNFSFLFDVSEPEDVSLDPEGMPNDVQPLMVPPEPPSPDAPKVCIIDSGVQEGHPLIAPAVDAAASYSYVGQPTDTADYVAQGGHGTKVAGLVLYHDDIPPWGKIRPASWIQNVRVLDNNNQVPANLSMAKTLSDIVRRYGQPSGDTRIFNHSINSKSVIRLQRMSVWAATLDGLAWNHDALFVVSTGNTFRGTITSGLTSEGYPDMLFRPAHRIANPAQSLQAITVGALALGGSDGNWQSIAQHSWPSSYTRIGPGIWDTIKPEVVEYAGDWGMVSGNPAGLTSRAELSVPVVTSTLHGNPSIGYDIGTSFAAPKVSHVLAQIEAAVPNESSQLHRALLIQSAAWPEWTNAWPPENTLRALGYGIPNVDRAISNTEHRITFITKGEPHIGRQSVHIYDVRIPTELQNPSEEYDIRIQITLAYKAQPRITRRHIRGYLSTWLTWRTSGRNEDGQSFLNRVMQQSVDAGTDTEWNDGAPIPWVIRERNDWGTIKGLSRDRGTVQKDWATVKSYELPETFSIAVIGHKGWSSLGDDTVPYSLVVSFEAMNQDVPMYSWVSIANEVEVTQKAFGI